MRRGAAANFVDEQLAHGRVCFSLPALTKATGLSDTAASNQLLRLGPLIRRISPKFYLIVTPENRAMGAPPPEQWLDDYFCWLEHPYYLGLLSAAARHGSSPQAVQETEVITDTPRRSIRCGRIRVDFFVKRKIAKSATQPLPGAFAPLLISTPEVTAFDLVRYAPRIGGFGRALETLRPLKDRIAVKELKATLEAHDEVSTAQRLGFAFEKMGASRLADVVATSLPGRPQPILLVSGSPRKKHTPVIKRWNLIDNSEGYL